MVLRLAAESDLTKLTEMVNNMYEELNYGVSFGEKWMLPRIKSKLFITGVLCVNSEIKAFCAVKIASNEYGGSNSGRMGFLYEMYTEPESRKKGYAGRLLEFMEASLKDIDVDYIELYVAKSNGGGYEFWQNSGFVPKYTVMAKKLS